MTNEWFAHGFRPVATLAGSDSSTATATCSCHACPFMEGWLPPLSAPLPLPSICEHPPCGSLLVVPQGPISHLVTLIKTCLPLSWWNRYKRDLWPEVVLRLLVLVGAVIFVRWRMPGVLCFQPGLLTQCITPRQSPPPTRVLDLDDIYGHVGCRLWLPWVSPWL